MEFFPKGIYLAPQTRLPPIAKTFGLAPSHCKIILAAWGFLLILSKPIPTTMSPSRYFAVLIFLLGIHPTGLSAQEKRVDVAFLNPALSFEQRADLLLAQMTLEEKVSQLVNDAKAIPRLHIPAYNWWNEALHGLARNGFATVFPQSITVAASFNRDLMLKIGTVVSDEARARHHEFSRQGKRGIYTGLDFWSPNINIFRDPRWGRGHETYGEDPFLTGELAVQFIKGMQGDDPKYLKTIATAKHFAVHSGPEALRHGFDVDVSDRDLYETYLPAFKKSVTEGKVYSIMSAYNRFRGVPASASTFLLEQVLREDWGFEGYVVSDCSAIGDIYNNHKVAASKEEAAAMGLIGGCDLNCGSYYLNLGAAEKSGLVRREDIDRAMKRLLVARFKLGMFDDPETVPFANIPYDIIGSEASNALARKAAQESMVLLKNEDDLLPLDKQNIRSIAVIGPNADNWESLVGNYHGTPKNPVTFLEGIQNKISPQIKVIYAEGSHLDAKHLNLKPIPSVFLTTKDGRQGLDGFYFNNTNWEGEPVLTKTDDNIDFWWEHQPINDLLRDNFSVSWEGFLVPPATGTYEIGLFAKRGMTIFLDGEEISSGKGTVHEGRYATGRLRLEAHKKYPITVRYFSDESDAQAQLLWARVDQNLREEAVEAARKTDLSIVVLGLSQRLEGEGGDRKDIELPEEQTALLKAIAATGKPVVLVLNAGSALAINWANDHIPAIISAGYPGEEGGSALADVLFGDYNPAGRLPVTYYRSIEDLPPFEDYNMKERTYRYYTGEPLYPFGYGLSYTRFEYSDLRLPEAVMAGDTLILSATITNTGGRAGDEVVQLYLSDETASTPRPIRQLEGFERVHLRAGESQTITFLLQPEQLSLINNRSERVIEPGWFTVAIGGRQPDHRAVAPTKEVIQGRFEVKGALKILPR